jgi:hypothetical protein
MPVRCTDVLDNDQSLGPSPIARYDAPVGVHHLRLWWGDTSKVVTANVISGQTAIVGEYKP